MRASGGTRLRWDELPDHVRAALEEALGGAVVATTDQAGGFSPGLAVRCTLADGSRAFVKAVSPAQNPHACRIHRREAEVAARLPPSVPAPRLHHVHDDGEWIALVFEDLVATQPPEPWTFAELDLVVPQLRAFTDEATPSPVPGLQTAVDRHRAVFDGFRRLATGDGDATRTDPWVRSRLERLAEIETGWEAAAAGDALIHADLRADNLLVDEDDRVWIVDWPWACVGSPHLDLAMMLPSIGLGGGPDPGTVVERYRLFTDLDPDRLRALVVAITGFFTRAALDPSPPGLPTLRRFQQAQADIATAWLHHLLG